jgi:hypothetical protein
MLLTHYCGVMHQAQGARSSTVAMPRSFLRTSVEHVDIERRVTLD